MNSELYPAHEYQEIRRHWMV